MVSICKSKKSVAITNILAITGLLSTSAGAKLSSGQVPATRVDMMEVQQRPLLHVQVNDLEDATGLSMDPPIAGTHMCPTHALQKICSICIPL